MEVDVNDVMALKGGEKLLHRIMNPHQVGDVWAWDVSDPKEYQLYNSTSGCALLTCVDDSRCEANLPDVTVMMMLQSLPRLLDFTKWAILQLQGESGAGHSHWEQFPEYCSGVAAVDLLENLDA